MQVDRQEYLKDKQQVAPPIDCNPFIYIVLFYVSIRPLDL